MDKSLPLCFCIANERLTLRRASRVLAESEYSARKARKYTKGIVSVVPHPLRDKFLDQAIGARSERRVVFLGAFNERKGIKDAITAFAKGAPADWNLLCVGGGTPGYEEALQNQIRELDLSGRVEFRRGLSSEDIIRLYQESPVFLLPSYMDTGPTALKEALAMGLWPVCYDNSGPRELVGRYGYGSLSPAGDILALTESLRTTLDGQPWTNAERLERCVAQVRHDLCRETVWKLLVESYSDEFWTDAAK
jgi:glycosyltransferase involved in cell wall biosynthesis